MKVRVRVKGWYALGETSHRKHLFADEENHRFRVHDHDFPSR